MLSASTRGSWAFQWKKSMISRNKNYANTKFTGINTWRMLLLPASVFLHTFRPDRLSLLREGIQRSMSIFLGTISSRFSRSNSNFFLTIEWWFATTVISIHDILDQFFKFYKQISLDRFFYKENFKNKAVCHGFQNHGCYVSSFNCQLQLLNSSKADDWNPGGFFIFPSSSFDLFTISLSENFYLIFQVKVKIKQKNV